MKQERNQILRFDEDCARADVVREALEWLGTPYHPQGRVKEAGTDCVCFLREVFERAGVIEHIEIPYYSSQHHLHSSEEVLKKNVLFYAKQEELPPARIPKPGDVIIFRVAKVFNHCAVVERWPVIIHAHMRRGIVLADAERDAEFQACAETAVFSVW